MPSLTIKLELSQDQAELFANRELMITPVTDAEAGQVGQTYIDTAETLKLVEAAGTEQLRVIQDYLNGSHDTSGLFRLNEFLKELQPFVATRNAEFLETMKILNRSVRIAQGQKPQVMQ